MRHSEIKVAVAHVLRQLVGCMRVGALRTEAPLRATVLDFLVDTHRQLVSVASGAHSALVFDEFSKQSESRVWFSFCIFFLAQRCPLLVSEGLAAFCMLAPLPLPFPCRGRRGVGGAAADAAVPGGCGAARRPRAGGGPAGGLPRAPAPPAVRPLLPVVHGQQPRRPYRCGRAACCSRMVGVVGPSSSWVCAAHCACREDFPWQICHSIRPPNNACGIVSMHTPRIMLPGTCTLQRS